MERALALSQGIGDDEGIGRAYYNLSFLYERTEPERMVRLLETAQGHAAKSGDPALQMVIHNGLGNALETLSRPAEALEHYRQSTRFARELKQDHNLAVALANMAIIENQRARYAEARALMEEADAHPRGRGPDRHAGREPRQPGRGVARARRAREGPRALRARRSRSSSSSSTSATMPGPMLAARRAARRAGRARSGRGAAAPRAAARPRGRTTASASSGSSASWRRTRTSRAARARPTSCSGRRSSRPSSTAIAACASRRTASARGWRSGAATPGARSRPPTRRSRRCARSAIPRRSASARTCARARSRPWGAPPRPPRRGSAPSPCTPAPPPRATCTSGTASWRGSTRRWGRTRARASSTS